MSSTLGNRVDVLYVEVMPHYNRRSPTVSILAKLPEIHCCLEVSIDLIWQSCQNRSRILATSGLCHLVRAIDPRLVVQPLVWKYRSPRKVYVVGCLSSGPFILKSVNFTPQKRMSWLALFPAPVLAGVSTSSLTIGALWSE